MRACTVTQSSRAVPPISRCQCLLLRVWDVPRVHITGALSEAVLRRSRTSGRSAPSSAGIGGFATMRSDIQEQGRVLTDLQQIISDLEQQKISIDNALAALRGLSAGTPQRRRPGRPPGTRGPGRPPKKRSTISEEGRQRIAEAQRQRWAAKKAAAKKIASKTVGNTASKTAASAKKTATRKRSVSKQAAAKKSREAS